MKKIFLTLTALAVSVGMMSAGEVTYNFGSPTDGLYGLTLAKNASEAFQTLPHEMSNGPVSVVLSNTASDGSDHYGYQLFSNSMHKSLSVLSGRTGSTALSEMTVTAGDNNVTGVKIILEPFFFPSENFTVSFDGAAAAQEGDFTTGFEYNWTGDQKELKVSFKCDVTQYIQQVVVTYGGDNEPVADLKDPGLSFDVEEFTYYQLSANDPWPVLNNPNGVPVTWSSSNTDVAWFMTGMTEPFAMTTGEAIITAKSTATSEFKAGEASYRLIVKTENTGAEGYVDFPATLNVTSDAEGEFTESTDWGMLVATGNLSTSGSNVTVTVPTPEGWTGVYYVEPSSDAVSTSALKKANAAADYDENSEWVSEDYMRRSYKGVKGNSFTVPADGQTYEYSIYFQKATGDEATVYVAKHAMVSVTALPPFEAPSNLSLSVETLNGSDVEIVYEDESLDYGYPTINVTATVAEPAADEEAEKLNLTFDIPAGWTGIYHSPAELMGGFGPDLMSKVRRAPSDEEFGWYDAAELEAAGFVGERMFTIPGDQYGTYMMQVMLEKDGKVATGFPYALVVNVVAPVVDTLEAPETLDIKIAEFPDAVLVTEPGEDVTYITGSVQIVNYEPSVLNFEVAVPEGWDAIMHSPTEPDDSGIGDDDWGVLRGKKSDYEWAPAEALAEAGFVEGNTFSVNLENMEPMVQFYLVKGGQVAVNKMYYLEVAVDWQTVYTQKEFNLVLGGMSYPMYFEGQDENGGGIYTALVEHVSAADDIVISDGEESAYTPMGALELNSEWAAYLTLAGEGVENGHLSTDGMNVTFTFVDNPGWEMWTLKAAGSEVSQYGEWVLVTENGMVNLEKVYSQDAVDPDYDDFDRYEAHMPLLMTGNKFYILNRTTNAIYSAEGAVELNGEFVTYLGPCEAPVWMYVSEDTQNAVVTFENHSNWEMMTLTITGRPAGESSEWVLVLNGEEIPFAVKEANIEAEDYLYEVAVPVVKESDSFYIYNKEENKYYSTGSAVSVNGEYPAYLMWVEDVDLMTLGADYTDVVFTFHNNVGWEMMTLEVSGTLSTTGGAAFYLKGNIADNGNGNWDEAPGKDAFRQIGSADEQIWVCGPVEFGAFKSFAVWGGAEEAWYSIVTEDPGWNTPTLAAEDWTTLHKVEEFYAMAPEEQGNYLVVLDFSNAENPRILLSPKSFDDFVTAIRTVGIEGIEAIYFDLNGNRRTNPEKGIYIKVNGNKAERVMINK